MTKIHPATVLLAMAARAAWVPNWTGRPGKSPPAQWKGARATLCGQEASDAPRPRSSRAPAFRRRQALNRR